MLAAVSLFFQFMPFTFLPTASGMRIDFVAVPWIISAFLLGPLGMAITSFVSFLVIGFAGGTGFFGAAIKLVASLPLAIAFLLAGIKWKMPNAKILASVFITAVVARVLIAHVVNYYFTFPAFGIPVDATINELVPGVIPIPTVSWLLLVDALNVVQSAIEFGTVYVLLFRTRLAARLGH
jgi:riboflavin transporter FmnP